MDRTGLLDRSTGLWVPAELLCTAATDVSLVAGAISLPIDIHDQRPEEERGWRLRPIDERQSDDG